MRCLNTIIKDFGTGDNIPIINALTKSHNNSLFVTNGDEKVV